MININSINVMHKQHGEGKIITINPCDNEKTRIFIRWKNKSSILAGWYDAKDSNLEFEPIRT